MRTLSKNVVVVALLGVSLFLFGGCSAPQPTPSAPPEEQEAIARTEFTDRVENYFEYEPLRAGKPSQVRIHLTNLSTGAPVENAEVSLLVRSKGSNAPIVQTIARVGKVTGIYVADLNIPRNGAYDVEFHIKNSTLDEHLPLTDFNVE